MLGRAENVASELGPLLGVAADLAACDAPADLEEPLRSLQDLLGADAIGTGELRREPPGTSLDILPQATFPERFDAESLSYWAEHGDEHPVLVRQLAGIEPRPLRLTDFLSRSRLRRLGIYQGYRRLGLRGEISLQVDWEPSRMACLTAHRAQAEFGERERDLLGRLRPHLRAARTRIELNRRLRRERQLLEAGLERSGAATALVGAGGRIAAASGNCAALLDRWFPSRRGGCLPEEVLAWLRQQRRRADPTPLRRAAAGRLLEVSAASSEDGCLLLLLRERRLDPPDAATLAAALPITRRQAEVLALVSAGLADAAIANQLGISVRTVGHHVQHLLGRLDVPTRTAAAALALRLG